jgi:hypothetical protein
MSLIITKKIKMKTIFKILFILNFLVLTQNCKAQTTNDYVTFYNNIIPKLNTIIPNKTQFYGQNFSVFYNELQNKNIDVVSLSCGYKTDPGIKYYVLDLFFEDEDLWSVASNNNYQYPWISITFESEIPSQIKNMILQAHGQWDYNFIQFFANMKIEKILFVGVRGYDNPDYTGK